MNPFWIKLGSTLMFLAVGLGAFGAHALKAKLTPHYLDVYKTGVLYQMIHALALFAVAWMATQSTDPKIFYAGVLFTIGIALFSGSLYILAVTEIKWIGAITPLGGLSFLSGWILLALSKF